MLLKFTLEGGNLFSIIGKGSVASAVRGGAAFLQSTEIPGSSVEGLIPAYIAAAEEAAVTIAARLREFPFKSHGKSTPHFKDSISVHVNQKGLDGVEIDITSDSPHAALLEFGSKGSYIIHPMNAQALMWQGNATYSATRFSKRGVAGSLEGKVFAKYAVHTGIRQPPKPFSTTIRSLEGTIDEIFRRRMDAALFSAGAASRSGVAVRNFGGTDAAIVQSVFQTGPRIGQTFFRGAGGRFVRGG